MRNPRARLLTAAAAVAMAVGGTVAATVPAASAATVATAGPAPINPAPDCPYAGRISYTLQRAARPTPEQASAYQAIRTAMDEAVALYNCHGNFTRALRVSYDPAVPTADATESGVVRFGARWSMQRITAMHEISHTLGVGTNANWSKLLAGGSWTGPAATAEVRRQSGHAGALLHGDRLHFWPYGLNQTTEVHSPADLVSHVRIVAALRRDMGL